MEGGRPRGSRGVLLPAVVAVVVVAVAAGVAFVALGGDDASSPGPPTTPITRPTVAVAPAAQAACRRIEDFRRGSTVDDLRIANALVRTAPVDLAPHLRAYLAAFEAEHRLERSIEGVRDQRPYADALSAIYRRETDARVGLLAWADANCAPGQGGKPGPATDGDDGGATAAPPTTDPGSLSAPEVSGRPAPTSRFSLRSAGGDRAGAVLVRGALGRHRSGEEHGGARLGDRCDFDPASDAAMPFSLTVAPEGHMDPYTLGTRLLLDVPTGSWSSAPVLDVDAETVGNGYGRAHAGCSRYSRDEFAVTAPDQTQPSATVAGWIVVHGFYGGAVSAKRAKLEQVGWSLGMAGPYRVDRATGAVEVRRTLGGTTSVSSWVVPFAPGFPLGCASTTSC